jgi:pentatricopeptide repeat protein
MSSINDLLESLAKRLDSELMEKIAELLPSMNMKMDARTYEVFLNMYFTTRSFQEVKSLASQMKENGTPFTARAAVAVIKTSLKTNNLQAAMLYFRELKSAWSSCKSTPSTAPMQVVSQLVDLACKEHNLEELLPELHDVPLPEEAVSSMLSECVRQKDGSMAQRVEKCARSQGITFTDATYGMMIKANASDSKRVRAIFQEVVEKRVEVSPDFVSSVLSYCAQLSDMQLADDLYKYMQPTQLPMLSTFIRFYSDNEQHERACDVYEKDLLRLHATTDDRLAMTLHLDSRMERSLMSSALKCGRSHLAKNLLSSSPSDIAKHITMIRDCGAKGDLKGAFSVFESLEKSGVDLNSVIYNTVLDACVECRDLAAAEAWMEQTKKAGMADVVSFNTLIKCHLQNKNFDKAVAEVEQIKAEGLQPNRVTFNELLNALAKGGEEQRKHMWEIVAQMTAADVKPNQVTISILLKNLNANSKQTEIMQTMDLINTMEEPMDEVLLSSVVEACVRIGRPELLQSKLKQVQGNNAITIQGSHTYGSLIKAHGHAKDINAVWKCWKEMRSRHIKPTSITLGCMVEAIVGNGDTEGAFELIHQMHDDEQCRPALNSVIYCSVLKGFTREKKIDRAWQVYEEMVARNIELSIITYNTLIDACARCGRMENLPRILEDMRTHRIKPNVITYSTMLKGHCQNGDIQTGFQILEQMKKDTHLKPDEIMYNSLLDGCAQNNLVEDGLQLLEEMQAEGVAPSNFTLSLVVKLMNRARKLDQAFAHVENITKKYNFRANVHVLTNLIQACCSNQQLTRGMKVFEQMIQDRTVPDSRTYAVLIRGSLTKGLCEQACGLLRGALGLPDALPFLQKSTAFCPNLDHGVVNETLVGLAERGRAEDLAAKLLSEIKKSNPRVWIERTTQQKIVNPCLTSESSPTRAGRATKGKGKGKGY